MLGTNMVINPNFYMTLHELLSKVFPSKTIIIFMAKLTYACIDQLQNVTRMNLGLQYHLLCDSGNYATTCHSINGTQGFEQILR